MLICREDGFIARYHFLRFLCKAFVPSILTVAVHLRASDNVNAFVVVFVLRLVHDFLAILTKMLHRCWIVSDGCRADLFRNSVIRMGTYIEVVTLEFSLASERLGLDKVCWHAFLIWCLFGRPGKLMVSEMNFDWLRSHLISPFTFGPLKGITKRGFIPDHPLITTKVMVVALTMKRIRTKILPRLSRLVLCYLREHLWLFLL